MTSSIIRTKLTDEQLKAIFDLDDNSHTEEEIKEYVNTLNSCLTFLEVVRADLMWDENDPELLKFGLPLRDYIELSETPLIILKDREFDKCVIGNTLCRENRVIYSEDLLWEVDKVKYAHELYNDIRENPHMFGDNLVNCTFEELQKLIDEEYGDGEIFSDVLQDELCSNVFDPIAEYLPIVVSSNHNVKIEVLDEPESIILKIDGYTFGGK